MRLSSNKSISTIVAIIVTFALLFSTVSLPEHVNAEAVEFLPFTILFTGGMHGNVEPFDFGGQSNYGGFAKAKTKIDEVRKELLEDRTWWRFGGNTLVLDVGNAIMGSKTGWLFANKSLQDVHPTIRAMNKIGYDAMLYGAGEFSMNKSIRDSLVSQSDFPWITANVVVGKERKKLPKGEYVMKVYKIPTAAHPLRYGVVGLTNPAVFTWENPGNLMLGSNELQLEYYVDKAQEHAETLKETGEKADFIIIATDLGLEKKSDGSWKDNLLYKAIQDITHIDFVCSSSTGVSFQQETIIVSGLGGKLHETMVCQLPEDGVTMGRMDLVLEKCTCPVKPYVFRKVNSRRQMKSRFIKLDPSVTPDSEIMKDFQSAKILMEQEFNLKIGEVSCTVDSINARKWDSEVVQIACDVMMKETGASIAFTDIWTTSAKIDKGSFTRGDLFDVFPKDAKIYSMDLKGSQIKAVLEHAATLFNTEADTNFIIAKGIDYYIDIRPGHDKVGYIKIGGVDLDMNKTYKVATNSYIALGQGGYDFGDAPKKEYKDLSKSIQTSIKRNGGKWNCGRQKNWFVVPDYLYHWSKQFVDVLMEKEIVGGDQFGRYSPDNFINRAAAAVMCLNIYDHPKATPLTGHYKDVSTKHWAYPYIEGGFNKGMWFWISGNYGLTTNATREEIMVNMIISSGDKAQAEALSAEDLVAFDANFVDADQCSPWAKKYVAYATKIGLVSGYAADGGKFSIKPKNNIRRSEVATLMAKARFPTIAIMGTADFRTEIEQWRIDPDADRPVGGIQGFTYTIGNLRGAYGANMLLDAGGFCQGTAWAELADGSMATGLINELGYDAVALGTKEFYLGSAAVNKLVADINAPVLASNASGIDGIEKSFIKDIIGIKVGVIGALNSDTTKYVCEDELGEVKITDMAEAINTEAVALKAQGAEVIVVIASAPGYIKFGQTPKDGFSGPAKTLAGKLNGVNVMFVSGSPEEFVAPSGDLWVVGAGEDGWTLGLAKVRFDTKNRTIDQIDATNEFALVNPSSKRSSAEELWKSVEKFVVAKKAELKKEFDRVIATTETGLNLDDSNESALGNLITSSVADQLGVDIVMFPSDDARGKGFAPGKITFGDLYSSIPAEDTWVVGTVQGKKLKDIAESAVSGERAVLQTHGFIFLFSRSSEPWNRVTEIFIGKGLKFQPDKGNRVPVRFNSKDEYKIAIPASEFYTLPSFGHEALSQVMKDVKSSCVYIRSTFVKYLETMTEAGQIVNQEIEERFKEP
jgi:2',3'-cyclic-nucleotide 2'-phosphodiesterase (5'-nucleotidase family)